jgi:SAM-dependent methyltransferase
VADTSTKADLYADPLIYDVLHAPGTAEEIRGVLRICSKHFASSGGPFTFLEPACGSGRCLIALAKRGHRCVGFDLSPAMVAFAQKAAADQGLTEQVRVFCDDMRSFSERRRIPEIDAAFNLINTIRHLGSDAAIISHLKDVSSVLSPRGIYVVGLSLCAYGEELATEDVWRGKGRGLRVTQVVQYLPPAGDTGRLRKERVISHLTVSKAGVERHIDSSYSLRGYSPEQFEAVIRKAGMEIAGCYASDGEEEVVPVAPGYCLYVLRVRG